MDQVMLTTSGKTYGPVCHARTFLQRWRGLRGLPEGASLLIRTSSVHGFGLRKPFRAIGLNSLLQVAGTEVVKPGRMARFPGCTYVLELPVEVDSPEPGMTLELRSV